MTAVEALRRARATCMHDHRGGYTNADCEGCRPAYPDSIWNLVVNGHDVNNMGTFDEWHERCASALLDGFSVSKLTAAEEELGR